MSDYIFDYSQYKNKINKKNNHFLIVFLVIILLLSCNILLCPTKLKTSKLYFIQTEESQTYQSSQNLSQDVIKNDGAGYIYFNKNYHVLFTFCSSYKDAKNMLKSIKKKHKNASIFSIENKLFTSDKNFNKTQNKIIKNFVQTSQNTSLKLENCFLSYFKNSLDIKTLSSHVENLKNDFSCTYNELLKSLNSNSKFNLAKKYANNMLKSITNLSSNIEQMTTSFIRYEIINFVLNCNQFLSCF